MFPDREMILRAACSSDEKRMLIPFLQEMLSFTHRVRREGLWSIEASLGTIEDAFSRKMLELIVDGTDIAEVSRLMHTRILAENAAGITLLKRLLTFECVLSIANLGSASILGEKFAALLGDEFSDELKYPPPYLTHRAPIPEELQWCGDALRFFRQNDEGELIIQANLFHLLSENYVQKVVHKLTSEEILQAMWLMSPEVKEIVLGTLSPEDAAEIRQNLSERMANRSEARSAMKKVLQIMHALEDAGEIALPTDALNTEKS